MSYTKYVQPIGNPSEKFNVIVIGIIFDLLDRSTQRKYTFFYSAYKIRNIIFMFKFLGAKVGTLTYINIKYHNTKRATAAQFRARF